MTFLKKLGSILLQASAIVTGFAPMFQQSSQAGAIQVVSKDLAELAQIVVQVETVGQALNQAGPAKFAAAAPLVAQVILSSSVLAGRKIHDQALFLRGCGAVGGGMADILNSLHDDVQTESKT